MANDRLTPFDIPASEVPANLTNFPVLFVRANLSDEMVDPSGGNATRTDGGDVRTFEDVGGTPTEIARQIVAWEHDSVSAAGDADVEGFMLFGDLDAVSGASGEFQYGDGTLTDYAPTDPLGRNAVWADYAAVWHLHGTGTQTDSTGNGHSLAEVGDPTAVAAPWGVDGGALEFDGTGDSYAASTDPRGNSSFTFQSWFSSPASSSVRFMADDGSGTSGGFQTAMLADGTIRTRIDDSGSNGGVFDTTTSYEDDTYRLFHMVADKTGNAQQYVNGVANGGSLDISSYGDISPTANIEIADQAGATNEWEGDLDEMRIRESVLSADWMATEYNNQSSPSTFIIEGTPADVGGGGATNPKGPFGHPFHGPFAGPIGP